MVTKFAQLILSRYSTLSLRPSRYVAAVIACERSNVKLRLFLTSG